MFDTERFIEEIKKRPAIYDVNRSEYNDRNAKMSAWEEVCQVMIPNWALLSDEERNMEEKSLRGKWRNIRDYFMKEFKLQLQKSLTPDSVRRKRKKYMYYDQLLFLMPTVENKLRITSVTGNVCKTEESEGEGDNPVIEESDVPLAHAVPSLTAGREYVQTGGGGGGGGGSFKMCPRYPKQLCETSLASFDNEIHDILSSHGGQRVTIDEEDYDKMFLLSLLPIIRQVPEERKLDVRIQIQQVLALALRPPDDK